MFCRGQPNSRESCIVLQSGPTRSLVAKFLQHSVIAWSTQILCCRVRMLRTRIRMDMRELLMSDVVVPKAHQSNSSYVSSADLPSESLHKILHGRQLHEEPRKLSKLGGGRLPGYGRLLRTLRYQHCTVCRKSGTGRGGWGLVQFEVKPRWHLDMDP